MAGGDEVHRDKGTRQNGEAVLLVNQLLPVVQSIFLLDPYWVPNRTFQTRILYLWTMVDKAQNA